MKTVILNQQTTHSLNLKAIQTLSNGLAERLEKKEADGRWGEVSIVLTDDSGITSANREFFGKDRPTDVISFRYDPVPGEEETTGDLIVNVDCAVREGPAHDGLDAELALYIAHGFNHLSGADDDTPARRAAMRRTEKRWLKSLYTSGFFQTPIS
jgi:probable rRNA maturation factor